MKLFEGKTKSERNKIIAAGLLGLVSIIALYMAFGRGSGSTSTTVKVTASPTPRPVNQANRPDVVVPNADEQQLFYESTPINYVPGNAYAPDAGRNIFAFYEPPPPCIPNVNCPPPPPPKPTATPPPPTPAPTPKIILAFVNPQNVYAGSKGFRLDINGERMVPEAKVYFNQREIPTRFINPSQLTAEVPADMIAREGPVQILVQTPDGQSYSNQFIFTIQAPPRPTFQYIGMIGRKRYNNDTAYFTETGRPAPFGARLNDIVAGRFRVVDISAEEVVFEDVSLGFRHKVLLTKASAGTGTGSPSFPGQPTFPIGQPQPPRRPPPSNRPDVDDDDPPRP